MDMLAAYLQPEAILGGGLTSLVVGALALLLVVRVVPLGKGIAWLVTNHRWFVALFLLMPASLVVNTLFYLRSKWDFYWTAGLSSKSLEEHEKRVRVVQDAIQAWIDAGRKTKLCSARPGWMAMSLRIGKYKKTSTGIPVQHLNNIVSVNKEARTMVVEPNVSMGQITHLLSPLGWTLPVLPELDDLTIGGLICGVGVEGSSHKYGLFQHNCVSFELVLADGSVVRCSKDENPDLFRSVPWSHGTLGFLVSAEIKIVPVTAWVRLEYTPLFHISSAVTEMQAAFNSDADFVEALAFSEHKYVLMKGYMTNHADPGLINCIGNWYKPWFFTHVANYLNTGSGVEYIPIRDYYHRHTRSIFWEIQDIITFGNNPVFRWLFGWLMPPHISVLKRTQTEELRRLYELHHVVQDMLVPATKLEETLAQSKSEFDVFPLWICPMRIFPEDTGFIAPSSTGEQMYVDVGIYGVPKAKTFHHVDSTRRVEDFVRSVDGYQMLYADMYQTKEEFRSMFHHGLYDRMRKELNCEGAFPEVYDKVSKAARH